MVDALGSGTASLDQVANGFAARVVHPSQAQQSVASNAVKEQAARVYMNHRVTDKEIGSAILEMLESREFTSSICPSEVARMLIPENGAWRSLMPDIRRVAQGLAATGVL